MGVRGRKACASGAAEDPHLLATLAPPPLGGGKRVAAHGFLETAGTVSLLLPDFRT